MRLERVTLDPRFVVVSGLPGSGKLTLSAGLSPLLGLPVIDKDDILERLFDAKGVGNIAWRRALSRESDVLFRAEAERSSGAILVSFWRQPGMPPHSGTPTDWLPGLSRRIVNLHCECSPAIAASRYAHRRRHAGHLDGGRLHDEVLTSIQKRGSSENPGHRHTNRVRHHLRSGLAASGQDYLRSVRTAVKSPLGLPRLHAG